MASDCHLTVIDVPLLVKFRILARHTGGAVSLKLVGTLSDFSVMTELFVFKINEP